MKRNKYFIAIFFLILSAFMLNLKVTYYQGINYEVRVKEIPLYMKIIDFCYRHCHYRELAREITASCSNEESKILALFEWTNRNIREVPNNFPIVDDHVWDIIVRGYGSDDQSADVFATLCVYAGYDALWIKAWSKSRAVWHAIAIVDFKSRKLVFDPYFGNYFRNDKGEIASLDDIIKDSSLVDRVRSRPVFRGIEYKEFFGSLTPIGSLKNSKSSFQVLGRRLIYEARKWITHLFSKP